MKQGGGVTRHEGVSTYIDLVVSDLSDLEAEFPQTADLFAAFARHRQGPSNFGFVELDKDCRLKDALSSTEEGVRFYQKLHANAPLITVSNSVLGNTQNTASVKTVRIADIEKDPLRALDEIADSVECSSSSASHGFLDGIAKLNRILELKPGAFGVSLNISGIIDGWIASKRSRK